jgi:hypothetical protein
MATISRRDFLAALHKGTMLYANIWAALARYDREGSSGTKEGGERPRMTSTTSDH